MTVKGRHNDDGSVDVKFNKSQMITIISVIIFSVIIPLIISYTDYKVFRSNTEKDLKGQIKFNNSVVKTFKNQGAPLDEFAISDNKKE